MVTAGVSFDVEVLTSCSGSCTSNTIGSSSDVCVIVISIIFSSNFLALSLSAWLFVLKINYMEFPGPLVVNLRNTVLNQLQYTLKTRLDK